MIISLSVFPIILLFVCSVKSVDNNKHDKDTQRYTVNHPPAVADYDTIPVTVLYDEYEFKEETSNTKSDLDKSDDTKEQHKVISIDLDELITKESLELKARSSSVGSRFTVANAEDSVLQKPVENKRNNRYRTQRKTLQQVRKTNVNNNETETKTNESTANKVAQKRSTTVKPFLQTSTQSPQLTTAKIQKRTGTRAPVVPIIESENYVYSHRGNFHYSYEGGDGTKAFERGELKKSENGSGLGEAVVGSYSYTDKDGNDFSLSYTADENGYRPVGAHLPTPPPIPPEIQAALRFLATKTTPEPVTEKVKNI